ncbi:AAA family ATPase [Burkholderia cepacia]|uniref:AAA family ATPase n=1 Tax=Burkholderia cepacia TaxID=292 RepID=UPI0015902779|nr:AAA family ATPase [Burkholderia cepacia]
MLSVHTKTTNKNQFLGENMLTLKRLLVEDAGAVERLDVQFEFTDAGNPKPLILVGENGSGKTTALSFIVDSLLQLASTKFDDVLAQRGMGNLFYRLRSHDVRIGATSSVAHVRYDLDGRRVDYVDRIGGQANLNQLRQRLDLTHDFPMNGAEASEKCWTQSIEQIAPALLSGAYVFFPSGRREVPHWLQVNALHPERYSHSQRFNNSVNKPLVVETAAEYTATWIMDGLLDRAAGYQDAGILVANQLLQSILEDPTAHFAVAPRNVWPRVQIYTGVPAVHATTPNPRRLLIPSLGHLSAGQSMLLSMFGTIANQGTLQQRRSLQDIEGIAVIDEAEVYLHTHLQRSVLPKLIKLFPKVQFVITTHSPTFLMGMKDEFGATGFQILNMPSGTAIDVDQFSEIGAAVEALRETTAFRSEVKAEVTRENERPILIVEGRSDAILIDGLWRAAENTPPPFRILAAKGRRALRYLLEDDEFIGEVGVNQRVLGLFDFDEAYDDWSGCHRCYPNHEGDERTGLLRRHVEKQIYAGLLPVPDTRARQAGERFGANSTLTIELYMPDEFLVAGQNFETAMFPGDVQIVKFRGDKVAFAERVSTQADLLPNFEALLSLIRRVLHV